MDATSGGRGPHGKKPIIYAADLSNLPLALLPLTKETRWAGWKLEARRGGGWSKVPYQALLSNIKARTNDPGTWSTYADALTAFKSGNADGISFMLGDTKLPDGSAVVSAYAALDLDHCRDPRTGSSSDWARAIVS